MKRLKKIITIIEFQIGVNVIGLPEIFTHDLKGYFINKSIFHK